MDRFTSSTASTSSIRAAACVGRDREREPPGGGVALESSMVTPSGRLCSAIRPDRLKRGISTPVDDRRASVRPIELGFDQPRDQRAIVGGVEQHVFDRGRRGGDAGDAPGARGSARSAGRSRQGRWNHRPAARRSARRRAPCLRRWPPGPRATRAAASTMAEIQARTMRATVSRRLLDEDAGRNALGPLPDRRRPASGQLVDVTLDLLLRVRRQLVETDADVAAVARRGKRPCPANAASRRRAGS